MSTSIDEGELQAMPCYADLAPWAIARCEQAFHDSLARGRRRRAARVDFVPGWVSAALEFRGTDVLREPGV